MTPADLPPLPEPPPSWIDDDDGINTFALAQMQTYATNYAKLAIREALERAASTLACHPCTYGDSPAFLRAMIEDYK